ncbi:hypothetical protein [Brasilonema bromeliae]|uniref:Uncharacterized protein n=1 Tax=Brasilonema bromeliae SPC951 TaxID=385972 RepID=A0ABX1P8R9_9CYAN|nr:hypothetical protein [Brasilonema bromeliae]NMG20197.1 hypothetical protein [Brasilonema bromeliae SPC951]
MNSSSDQLCQECTEVENVLEIDIKRLLKDLATYKRGKELTKQEKLYLCLSFLGNEPIDIARIENYQRLYVEQKSENPSLTEEKIHKLVEQKLRNRAHDISHYLSQSINQYILGLISTFDNSISDKNPRPSWFKIFFLLKANGYKKVAASSQKPSSLKRIVIESEDENNLQNIIELIKMVNQKFGNGSLSIEEIESEGDEDNEQK